MSPVLENLTLSTLPNAIIYACKSIIYCLRFVAFENFTAVCLQELTEKLLGYMHDLEYRVRRLFSVRAKVLFQTWDGHHGLFRDVW